MSGRAPEDFAQATLTIDLGALQDNWRLLRDRVAPARCAAVVKADGYGVGIAPAVRALAAAGCDQFFVAHVDEALRARAALDAAGRAGRFYVLNGLAAEARAARACAEAGLVPMLGCDADLALWREACAHIGRRLPLALMFDTGMNRLGFDPARGAEVAARIAGEPGFFDLVLIASHFVSSEAPEDPRNAAQIARFARIRGAFPGVSASLANSSGLFLPQNPWLDLARPGYALYGGNPRPGSANPMRPVVRLEARILQSRIVEAGESVGYNAQWTARRRARLVAIGVGYADGLPRNAMATDGKPGGEAIVGGVRCPFAGRVSMDLTVIDATDAPEAACAPGGVVELLGETISVDDLGARAGTIGYEILTSLGRRYARVYVGGA